MHPDPCPWANTSIYRRWLKLRFDIWMPGTKQIICQWLCPQPCNISCFIKSGHSHLQKCYPLSELQPQAFEPQSPWATKLLSHKVLEPQGIGPQALEPQGLVAQRPCGSRATGSRVGVGNTASFKKIDIFLEEYSAFEKNEYFFL